MNSPEPNGNVLADVAGKHSMGLLSLALPHHTQERTLVDSAWILSSHCGIRAIRFFQRPGRMSTPVGGWDTMTVAPPELWKRECSV